MLCKRYCIISAVKHRNAKYLKHTHKFGIEVLKTVAEAIDLDENNGNTLWQDAIVKDMVNVRAKLKILAEGGKPPPRYQKFRCHMMFDIKMEDFRRNLRLVAGGHVTKPPDTIMYARVLLKEIFVSLTVADLNNLQVRESDIQNTFIQAPVATKIWMILGTEFRMDYSKYVVIFRSWYGLKSYGDSFRNHLDDCMKHM